MHKKHKKSRADYFFSFSISSSSYDYDNYKWPTIRKPHADGRQSEPPYNWSMSK